MIDVEQVLRQELESFVPDYPPLDWSDVLSRADHAAPAPRRSRRVRRLPIIALAALVVVAFTTPLGAAVAHGIGDFSSWLRGQPGTPAPTSEQKAFERANARSWLHFPPNTQLRQLDYLIIPSTGQHVDLLGFRAGTSLCLRVVVTGTGRAQTQSCIPVATLQHASAPAQMVLADHGFGTGNKRAWFGLDHYGAPALQVSAGIAADGIRTVILEDQRGKHILKTHGNAFLYVAIAPEVGQRISHVWAKSGKRLVAVPFAPEPFGFAFGGRSAAAPVPGPTHVQRQVSNGSIGWLDRHQPVGEPLSKLTGRIGMLIRRRVAFGRLIVPDPTRPFAVAITSRHGGSGTGICTWYVTSRDVNGGGCTLRSRLFSRGPFSQTISLLGGSAQAATIAGVASDDVARIVAFLSGGGKEDVPLRDNAYVVDIPRTTLPARLVSYDNQGRIIGISPPISDAAGGARAARGKAQLLLTASDTHGDTAELYVGPATNGARCMYVRTHGRLAGGTLIDCDPTNSGRTPLAISTDWHNALVAGAVTPQVAKVILHFADGTTDQITPTKGFFLSALSPAHTRPGHGLTSASAVTADGRVIAHQNLAAPPHP